MQIANGIVVCHVHNQIAVRDVTPAEVLILSAMHFKESNGSPLKDFTVQPGEALTVDFEEKLPQPGYFNVNIGKQIPDVPGVPARTHKRTNAEEIARLKKKYTGTIRLDDGSNKPGFEAVFGSNRIITLPQTFAEIAEIVGIEFPKASDSDDSGPTEAQMRREELMGMKRHELAEIAIKEHKLKVAPSDTVEAIVDAIIESETEAAQPKTKAKKKAEAKAEAEAQE